MSNDTTQLVNELRTFFKDKTITTPVRLSPAETVVNIPRFLDSHFAMATNTADAKGADVFLQRIIKLKQAVERDGL